ncbi:uncharacterized protein LOC124141106 isoform X3 [Haliotis rufescens]|uniref:uncharacterized protein LOC124141106 isoform X3 n=1 Tax=Haliotis rufescens TaxID=6454 RepID=UPI00201EA8AB|nr:uncharacterized protein LOC124141106 isoform X3 [Haliotis rufescens]
MTMMLRVTLMVIVMLQGTLSLEQEYKDLLLRLHNDARADEGGSDMNQLVWDDQLEKEAGAWANGCVFEHQMKGRGENLAFNTNKNPETELTEIAFKAWFDEKNIYTYGQYSCGSSCHYTQLVWATTRRVGCAMKRCNYLSGGASNAWYLVCFYDPAGNKMGQKPYQRGGSCSKCRDDQSCSNRLCAGGADPCEDLDANCDVWANSMQQCTQNKEFMKEKCSLSCKFCKAGGKPAKGNSKQEPSVRKLLLLKILCQININVFPQTLLMPPEKALHVVKRFNRKYKDLPLDSAFKLFDVKIQQILLNSSELWGMDFHYSIEKVHTKFCKFILNISYKASNNVILPECGRFPHWISARSRVIRQSSTRYSKRGYDLLKKLDDVVGINWVSFVRITPSSPVLDISGFPNMSEIKIYSCVFYP